MKKVKVQGAIGMTLCHDITAMVDGFKGAAFKRGHVITQEDIPKLLETLQIDGRTEGFFVKLGRKECEAVYRLACR